MKKSLSTGTICLLTVTGFLITSLGLISFGYFVTRDHVIPLFGLCFIAITLFWLVLFIFLLRRKLLKFTDDLCHILDDMLNGNSRENLSPNDETLFSRLYTRLRRLYEVMEGSRLRVEKKEQELQSLVSDISHQVKTPVSNLKMLIDTLLEKSIPLEEQKEFLKGISSQTEKLDFLFGAMIKSSRLETGLIRLECVDSCLYDTLAQALSGIIYDAEQKNISVSVDCPESLYPYHDSRWTAEALFNILDNAVKYTPTGGKITVTVEEWEMYVKISICDTGCGIPEEQHAAVFRRFYREESVHETSGVGIGLYLAREIVVRQGGYIKLTSKAGKGCDFSVFLCNRHCKMMAVI